MLKKIAGLIMVGILCVSFSGCAVIGLAASAAAAYGIYQATQDK